MKYTQAQQQKGAELMKTLVEKAWENASFKDQLVKNPLATIQEVAGNDFSMPADKRIVVEDQTDENVIYLNIPAEPNLDELELSTEQLEMVSGGVTPFIVLAVATIAAGYGTAAALDTK